MCFISLGKCRSRRWFVSNVSDIVLTIMVHTWDHSEHSLWPLKPNQFILDPKLQYVPNVKKLPQVITFTTIWWTWTWLSKSNTWLHGWTVTWKHNASSPGYLRHGVMKTLENPNKKTTLCLLWHLFPSPLQNYDSECMLSRQSP